ncbi:MAG: carboxypeptidase regulatory-like domain-containing protein [Phycisphaerae bacterium]|nr:carboxypeptidase regulatory-like domain-containing protein [Phycisphaerae bacterium]
MMDAILEQVNSMGNAFLDFALPMLVQSSLLIIALLGLDMLLRKRMRAVCRYWIWMIVLVKLMLPTTLSSPTSPAYWFDSDLQGVVTQGPIVSGTSESTSPMTEPPTEVPAILDTMPVARPAEDVRPTPGLAYPVQADTGATVPPAVPAPSMAWQGLAMLLWLGVVITMTLLLVQRVCLVKGLIAQSKDAPPELHALLEQAQKQMKVYRRVALRLSSAAASPSVCGLFRPTILIPHGLTNRLSPQHFRSILLHELAHIKRGDLWVSMCQTLLQIAYIYNPFLWVANAVIRRVREAAVDETVLVAMGEQAEEYPRMLLDVSKLTFSRPAWSLRLIGVVESKRALSSRIRHIVSRPFPETARLGFFGLLGVLVAAAVLLPMARAQKDESIVSPATTSTALTFEGPLEFHKPLPVGIVAGTEEHPDIVRIEWLRFETIAGNAWGVTAHVGWLPETETSWQLKVELLDKSGRVLQHVRDEPTMFTLAPGQADQVGLCFVDLDLDFMQYEGRRHAKLFRVYLEPWQEEVKNTALVDPEMCTLDMTVVDQTSETPLADAAVVVRSSFAGNRHPQENGLYSTDSQGRCQIELSGDGLALVRVGAQKQGFAINQKYWSNSGSWPVGGVMLARLPHRHVLELIRAGSVGGFVQDKEGKPLSEVEVRLNAYVEDASGMSHVSRSVKTDADGRWQVDGVPLELGPDRMSIGLRHAEYGGDNGRNRYLTGQALLDARALKHVETLDKGLVVTGKVLNDRGEPVPSATVMRASRSFNPLPALTDESGAFRWACMADVSAYDPPCALVVEAPGYAPVEQAIDLTQTLDGLEIRLTRGRSITCRVVDTEGEPVVGAWTVVHRIPENSAYSLWQKGTDARGECHVPSMPESDVDITVLKSGYIAVRDLVVGASEDEVVITMRRAMRVSGTVTDAQSGSPIPSFEIAGAYTSKNGPYTSTPSIFVEGMYDLSFDEATPETLQLKAFAVGYEPATSKEIKIDEGQRIIDFKLVRSSTFDETTAGRPREEIQPTGPRRITGKVRDGEGNPVSDAIVSIRPWLAENATTDAKGSFALRTMGTSAVSMREETTTLFARHKARNLAAAIELGANANKLEIDLIPGAILCGRVADAEGKGIPGTVIILYFWHLGSGYPSREETQVDAQGYYEIRAVPSGHSYSVHATAEGYDKKNTKIKMAKAAGDRIEFEPLFLVQVDSSGSRINNIPVE